MHLVLGTKGPNLAENQYGATTPFKHVEHVGDSIVLSITLGLLSAQLLIQSYSVSFFKLPSNDFTS